jgi:beta-phosphoglucomutase-like phosphatase (HAD superfamily)
MGIAASEGVMYVEVVDDGNALRQSPLIKAVISDVDGTFLDMWEIMHKFASRILGKKISSDRWDSHITDYGVTPSEWKEIVALVGPASISCRNFNLQMSALVGSEIASCEFFTGAVEVVRRIASKGIPMGIATSVERESDEEKIKRHGAVFSLFRVTITRSDVRNRKPHPESFQRAARALDSVPENTLVFENDEWCLAQAAGVGFATALFLGRREKAEGRYDHVLKRWREFSEGAFTWQTDGV